MVLEQTVLDTLGGAYVFAERVKQCSAMSLKGD